MEELNGNQQLTDIDMNPDKVKLQAARIRSILKRANLVTPVDLMWGQLTDYFRHIWWSGRGLTETLSKIIGVSPIPLVLQEVTLLVRAMCSSRDKPMPERRRAELMTLREVHRLLVSARELMEAIHESREGSSLDTSKFDFGDTSGCREGSGRWATLCRTRPLSDDTEEILRGLNAITNDLR